LFDFDALDGVANRQEKPHACGARTVEQDSTSSARRHTAEGGPKVTSPSTLSARKVARRSYALASGEPLSLIRGTQLLDELLEGYSDLGFQKRLVQFYSKYGYDEADSSMVKARQELFLTVQAPILPKFGFEPSPAGVHKSFMVLGVWELSKHPEIQKRNAAIGYFTKSRPIKVANALSRQQMGQHGAPKAGPASFVALMGAFSHHLPDISISVSDGQRLLGELLEGYSDPDFQDALTLVHKSRQESEDEVEFVKGRRALTMSVQATVLPKYGFEASQDGVQKSYCALINVQDAEIQKMNREISFWMDERPSARAHEMILLDGAEAAGMPDNPADLGSYPKRWPLTSPPAAKSTPSTPVATGGHRCCALCLACAELYPNLGEHKEEMCALWEGIPLCILDEYTVQLRVSLIQPASWAQMWCDHMPVRLLSLVECDWGGSSAEVTHETGWSSGVSAQTCSSATAHTMTNACPDGVGRSGLRIWPVAWLLLEVLQGVRSLGRVLELGAGTGIVGLSLARRGVADSLVLTDSDQWCIRVLRANAALNCEHNVSVATLALGEVPEEPFDVVVASDVLWEPSQSAQLLVTVESALRGSGGFFILGFQHRHPAVKTEFMVSAAHRGAVVREVHCKTLQDGLGTTRLSVYLLEYRECWRLPGGPIGSKFSDDKSKLLPLVLEQRPGRVQCQVSNWTEFDRYTDIFLALQAVLGASSRCSEGQVLRILSFGCSDGSECRSMRTYLAEADVDGVDIWSKLIEENKAHNTDPRIRYFDDLKHLAEVSYDAVLMMTVLCRYGDTEVDFLQYEVFDQTVTEVDKYVRPGGYMVIYNSNYLLTDSSVAHRYQNMAASSDTTFNWKLESGFVPKYERSGKLLSDNGADYPHVFFKKLSSAE